MIIEWVVAKPWFILACVSCELRLSIPARGPQRNQAPVFCPQCGEWFAYRPPPLEFYRTANQLLNWPVITKRIRELGG